jgi:hypothetical protein
MLVPWDQENILKGQNSEKVVPSSSPRKGDSCRSETRHDRRTVARPRLIKHQTMVRGQKHESFKTKVVCAREEITEREATVLKTFLGLSPSENVFCSLDAKQNRRLAKSKICFSEKSTETKASALKICPGEDGFCSSEDIKNNFCFVYSLGLYFA